METNTIINLGVTGVGALLFWFHKRAMDDIEQRLSDLERQNNDQNTSLAVISKSLQSIEKALDKLE